DGFRQAARLYANHVRDDAMAGRCLEEVLALEPEAETDFEVLDAILRARGDAERLAQVMRRRAAAGPMPKRRDRLLALADLIYERDPIESASVLGEAVTLDSSSVPALNRLVERGGDATPARRRRKRARRAGGTPRHARRFAGRPRRGSGGRGRRLRRCARRAPKQRARDRSPRQDPDEPGRAVAPRGRAQP